MLLYRKLAELGTYLAARQACQVVGSCIAALLCIWMFLMITPSQIEFSASCCGSTTGRQG